MTSAPIGPGRTGAQTASWRTLRTAALLAVTALVALSVAGLWWSLIAFFAVGAGAGYSLSGSV